MARRRTSPTGEGGFSLLEMLAVLALLGLILAVVPPVLGVGTASARLRADSRGLAAALANARSEAILAGREVAFVVDAARRTYGLGGAMDGRLDDGTRIDLLTAAGNVAGGRAAFRFRPDGSSSGGEIRLANSAGELVLRIDWLTGRVE